jgi:hypothetical protein
MAGVFFTAWLALLAHFFTVLGTVTRRMGGTAEQETAKVLLRLDRRHYVVINHLLAGEYDIDHVVASGGHLLVVETKWTTSPMSAMPNGHLKGLNVSWVRQVDRSARWVKGMATKAGYALPVTPVLVLWGPGVDTTTSGRFNSGRIHVLIGEQSTLWVNFVRELLGADPAPPDLIDALVAAGESL